MTVKRFLQHEEIIRWFKAEEGRIVHWQDEWGGDWVTTNTPSWESDIIYVKYDGKSSDLRDFIDLSPRTWAGKSYADVVKAFNKYESEELVKIVDNLSDVALRDDIQCRINSRDYISDQRALVLTLLINRLLQDKPLSVTEILRIL